MALAHFLLNAIYVIFGVVVGRLLAWVAGIERRISFRRELAVFFSIAALVVALLLTWLTPSESHLVAGIAAGVVGGCLSAMWSRLRARPTRPPRASGPVSRS